jgi:hypothetical protein
MLGIHRVPARRNLAKSGEAYAGPSGKVSSPSGSPPASRVEGVLFLRSGSRSLLHAAGVRQPPL